MQDKGKILHGNLAKVDPNKKIDPSYLANALTDYVTQKDGNIKNSKEAKKMDDMKK